MILALPIATVVEEVQRPVSDSESEKKKLELTFSFRLTSILLVLYYFFELLAAKMDSNLLMLKFEKNISRYLA